VFWGRRKRIKSVQHQKKEHFSESRKALSYLLFFLYFFALKKKAAEAEGRGQRVFFIFFFALLFRRTALSSFSLFFSLSSFLSLFSQAACLCVFAREFSPHLKLFGGGSSSNHHRNLSSHYKSKHNNTQSAFYVVNAQKNKNRTHFKAESERELLFDRL